MKLIPVIIVLSVAGVATLFSAAGNILWTQLRTDNRHGTGLSGQSFTGASTSGHYATFDASGNVVDGGVGCASLGGDVTGTCASNTVSKIQGTTVSGTTGTGNVVFSSALGSYTPTSRTISTTSPLGGGGDLSADRTLACSTCVVASSPGAGLAHFAGSTQTVTSSAVVSADLNITTTTCSSQFVSAIAAGGTGTCAGLTAAEIPSINFVTPGTSHTFTNNADIFVCTSTCTITVPVPSAGLQYCVRNGDNVSTVITLSALGSSAMYENQAWTAFGTAGTGTLVSGGAVKDFVCILGQDATHYLFASGGGTWTAN